MCNNKTLLPCRDNLSPYRNSNAMASDLNDGMLTIGLPDISQQAEVLQELANIATNVANTQLDSLITRLSEALLRMSETSADAHEARRYAMAAGLLKKNRYPFYYIASERIAALLQRETQRSLDPSLAAEVDSNMTSALSPELEVDKKLSLLKASRTIEQEHAVRLMMLGMRLASLLERNELTLSDNPFRPHLFLSLLHDAWCEFQPDPGSHHLLFRVLGPQLCIDMGPILHALNAALIKRGILPQLAEPQGTLSPNAQEQVATEAPDEDPLIRQLHQLFPAQEHTAAKPADRPLFDAFPSLFQEEVLHATRTRDALLDHLARHHAFANGDSQHGAVLPAIKQSIPQDLLTPADIHAIDLVAAIFDAVFNDKHISDEIKGLIGSLQLPVLKAALTDKNFFFTEAHPARRVIELLTRSGLGWDRKKGHTDPLYPLIQRNVRRIQQESEQRIGVFADAAADLEAFIKREDTAAAQALAAPIARALQHEKLQQATAFAKNEVALRIGTGEVVAFVETFLENKWVPVLTLAYGVKDEKPQVLRSALGTMDDLVWSVKPKITQAERKELLAKLPVMVAALNKWLDLVKWDDAERARFFKELAACHASIVRAPLELSPERQMQIALAAAKKAAERRQRRLERQVPEPEPDAYDEQVQQLQQGVWVKFARDDGAIATVRLAWVSPMRSMYIFATKDRQEAASLSAEQLAHALREQRAQLLSTAGVVGRALAQALGVDSSANTGQAMKPAA